jgi:hypothetical protein
MTLNVRSLLISLFALYFSVPALSDVESNSPSNISSKEIKIQVAQQPWQKRRADFSKIVQGLRENSADAKKDFDAVLTEFETRTLNRTPIENMEILGVFYVPKGGVDPALSVIAMNAVLGWYDALRFASESGRAEITNNEGFFKKSIILGDPETQKKAVKFLQNNPERVAQLLAQGMSYAEKFRETSSYDRLWVTAYGMEKYICKTGGSCQPPQALPKEQWDSAWKEAKQRVTSYYTAAKQPNANELPAQSSH